MPLSPTVLTLRQARDMGMTPEVVEYWNHYGGVRHDLFGFIDVLALGDNETLAIQTTTQQCVSEHIHKIAECKYLAAVRKAGWRIEVHGWHKVNRKWKCIVVDVS